MTNIIILLWIHYTFTIMASNLLDDTIEDVFRTVFETTPDELLVVNPSADVIEALVAVATDVSEFPRIRLLGDEATLKTARGEFTLASNAANLIDDDTLTIRAHQGASENSLLVTPTEVVALVTAGDTVVGLSVDDNEFVSLADDVYMSAWEDADEFTLRTPSRLRMRATLADEIGDPVETDFTGVLDSLETARSDANGSADLDPVIISLLVAAKHGVQLYDISRWGEDVGLASKATFSRTKTRLEDEGLLDTEKVPIDVGRPRLRLMFGDDRLGDASTDQLASVA